MEPARLSTGMDYRDQTIAQFCSSIASTNVVPAGGSAAAVVGATGAALCELTCIHTVEKEEFADVASDLARAKADLERQRSVLLDLADRDAAAVEALLAAADDETRASTAKRATGVPLAIAEACQTVLEQAVVVTATGSPRAVPDAVTGAFLARAALQAAVFTVRTNRRDISDEEFVADVEQRVGDVETASREVFDRVMANAEDSP